MTKISSAMTGYYKRGFPLIWFGFLAFFIATSISAGVTEKDILFLVVPCIMAVAGFFMMKKFVWDLADQVEDGGDFLLVKNNGKEDRIKLTNIMNVSTTTNVNPPRITLRLIKPGVFGNEIAFSQASDFSLNPFSKNKIAEDLIVRVDQARSRRAI
jgi:hypothetical protein